MAEQVSDWESLDYGVVHTSRAFADFPDANQLREVWLAALDAATVFERAEEYYAQHGLTCRAWTPASGQPIEPVEALLASKGWQRMDRAVMALVKWDVWDHPADGVIRVLPARAMRKAYRATFEDGTPLGTMTAAAAFRRLDDSNLDAFVAMLDGRPGGRISYLSVGDAARVADVFVLPQFRRRRLGTLLVAHVLQIARRLLPKVIVASSDLKEPSGRGFLKRSGFAGVGELSSFCRPK